MNNLRFIILSALVCLAMGIKAQNADYAVSKTWRAGIVAGSTVNWYSQEMSYQYDWKNRPRSGMQFGATGQYNINEWLGVRADLIWMQRDYRHTRTQRINSFFVRNGYLMLPVMASFSFGGERLKGFLNAGVYGGYWMSQNREGTLNDMNFDENVDESTEFNSTRDARLCFGYAGGVGMEYRISRHFAAQLEARMYYDVTSQVKQYQRNIEDYRYNITLGLQTNIFYCF